MGNEFTSLDEVEAIEMAEATDRICFHVACSGYQNDRRYEYFTREGRT